MKLPKKTKCNSEFGNYMRHKWLYAFSSGTCARCKKQRNPAAGTKMFRFKETSLPSVFPIPMPEVSL